MSAIDPLRTFRFQLPCRNEDNYLLPLICSGGMSRGSTIYFEVFSGIYGKRGIPRYVHRSGLGRIIPKIFPSLSERR